MHFLHVWETPLSGPRSANEKEKPLESPPGDGTLPHDWNLIEQNRSGLSENPKRRIPSGGRAVREMVDSQGDPALEAILVFANAVTDEELRWRKIEPVVAETRRIVRETMADGKYVFFKVRRRKELATA